MCTALRPIVAVTLLLTLLSSFTVEAQPSNDDIEALARTYFGVDEDNKRVVIPESRDTVFGQISSLGPLAVSLMVFYEHRFSTYFGLSIGAGGSCIPLLNANLYNLELMANVMTPGSHKFVIGVGLNAMLFEGQGNAEEGNESPAQTGGLILPSLHLGYRYQPDVSGFFMEVDVGIRGVGLGFGATL